MCSLTIELGSGEGFSVASEAELRLRAMEELRSGLWEKLRETMMYSTLPIILGSTLERKILGQGSMTFLDTGDRLIGVTAAHVVEGLRKKMAEVPSRLYINSVVVDDFDVIDLNEGVDLATVQINDSYLQRKRPLTRIRGFSPAEQQCLLVSGFPASSNTSTDTQMIYGLFHGMGFTKSVSADRISYEIERGYGIDELISDPLPKGTDLGGISGGPMISFAMTTGGLNVFQLSAVVSQAHQEGEYIIGTRTSQISDDGSIISQRI